VSWTLSKLYAKTIADTVLTHAHDGKAVLIVTHKAMIERKWFPVMFKAEEFKRREITVRLLNWGNGIGSNDFNDCTTVFQFSERYPPNRAFAVKRLGKLRQAATIAALRDYRQRSNRKRSGPLYLQREGECLRWCGQLAARGTTRNIKDDGSCGDMRMFIVHEDVEKFETYVPLLFPGQH
jgi:hypothetical protein